MSNTVKHKDLGKRKRLHKTSFIAEKMMDRKCGSIDDKVNKLEALRKAEKEVMKEVEELLS